MANKDELLKKIAYLESLNDQLSMELKYVDKLLRRVGFPDGMETIKSASEEFLEIQENAEEDEEDEDNK